MELIAKPVPHVDELTEEQKNIAKQIGEQLRKEAFNGTTMPDMSDYPPQDYRPLQQSNKARIKAVLFKRVRWYR